MIINSLTNAKVKAWMRLHQKKYRKEGYLLADEALTMAAYQLGFLKELLYCADQPFAFEPAYALSPTVIEKLAGKKIHYLGVGKKVERSLLDGHYYFILDDLQDPGNIGTLIRNAEIFGVDGLILSHDTADIYHEKCLLKAQESIFKVPLIRCELKEAILKLKEEGFKIYATGLTKETKELAMIKKAEKTAFILGNEGAGVKQELLALSDEIVKIPMENIDSLNVASAGTIIMYNFQD